jgi:hypothetical protein
MTAPGEVLASVFTKIGEGVGAISTTSIYYYVGTDGRALHFLMIEQDAVRQVERKRLPILIPLGPDNSAVLKAKSYSCWITRRGCTLAWQPNQASPGGTGGKRRHPRGVENTGIRTDKPEAQ